MTTMLSVLTTPADVRALRAYARSRDPEAFEVLVRQYQAMVLATCRRVLGSSSDAVDAAQETFFKLARHAASIRSHPAAWLHRVAVGTSIDMLRARASDADRQRLAAQAEVAAEAPDPTWQEIKPKFDEALASLDSADRDLIVTRFLLGRSQVEMARESRVSEGTLSRRLERALEKLRVALRAAGVQVATAGGLAAGILAGIETTPSSAASPAVISGLMEVGLAGVGGTKASAMASLPLAAMVSGLLIASGVVGGFMLAGGGERGAAVAVGGISADRPKRAQRPLIMRSALFEGRSTGRMVIAGNTITLIGNLVDNKGDRTFVITMLSADDPQKPTSIRCILKSVSMPRGEHSDAEAFIGREFEMRCRVDADTVTLEPLIGPPENPNNGMVFRGIREASSSPPAGESIVPGIVGSYTACDPWRLLMSPDQIEITAFWGSVRKFRILEWTVDGDIARVQAICNGGQLDASMIGKRVKLLVRKDQNGWTIAHHNAYAPQLNEWPKALESTPGSQVHLYTFAGEVRE